MTQQAKVLLIFAHRPEGVMAWPRLDYDYDRRKREILSRFKKLCPNMRFDAVTACSIEDAEKVLKGVREYDGVVLYLLGSGCPVPLLVLERCDKPTILVDEQYCGSGTFALAYGWMMGRRLPAIGIASSRFQDVVDKVKLISVVKRLKNSRIVVVTPKGEKGYVVDRRSELLYGSGSKRFGGSGKTYDIAAQIERVRNLFGIEVIKLGYRDVKRYFDEASVEEAKSIADRWMQGALRVVEPSREEVIRSARLYLGLKKMIHDHDADAITIDCYRRFEELPAYPCLAFFQLNNDGVTAVCEADLSSTITQLLIRYLTEELTGEPRPGFVNDPVADFAKGWIIYCHCTAPSKVFGPNSGSNPYIIRSHAESRAGAAIQSLMPTGELVTAAQIHFMKDPPLMVVHGGRSVCNIDSEDGCRTKLAAEARVEIIFSNWNKFGGWIAPAHWHRVVVYGDWRKHLKDLARLMRMDFFEEDV